MTSSELETIAPCVGPDDIERIRFSRELAFADHLASRVFPEGRAATTRERPSVERVRRRLLTTHVKLSENMAPEVFDYSRQPCAWRARKPPVERPLPAHPPGKHEAQAAMAGLFAGMSRRGGKKRCCQSSRPPSCRINSFSRHRRPSLMTGRLVPSKCSTFDSPMTKSRGGRKPPLRPGRTNSPTPRLLMRSSPR